MTLACDSDPPDGASIQVVQFHRAGPTETQSKPRTGSKHSHLGGPNSGESSKTQVGGSTTSTRVGAGVAESQLGPRLPA